MKFQPALDCLGWMKQFAGMSEKPSASPKVVQGPARLRGLPFGTVHACAPSSKPVEAGDPTCILLFHGMLHLTFPNACCTAIGAPCTLFAAETTARAARTLETHEPILNSLVFGAQTHELQTRFGFATP